MAAQLSESGGSPSPGQEPSPAAASPQERATDYLCQHAFDVFSQLFSQVDFTVIDGFSYISGGNATFTSLNLLKFGRNYLNGALADEQLQLLFLDMDADCDGKVTAADWQNYFGAKLAHKANTAAPTVPRTSAVHAEELARQPWRNAKN